MRGRRADCQASVHVAQIGPAPETEGGVHSAIPLHGDDMRAGPQETRPPDADAVFHRLAARQDEIEAALLGRHDDGARRVGSLVVDLLTGDRRVADAAVLNGRHRRQGEPGERIDLIGASRRRRAGAEGEGGKANRTSSLTNSKLNDDMRPAPRMTPECHAEFRHFIDAKRANANTALPQSGSLIFVPVVGEFCWRPCLLRNIMAHRVLTQV